MEGIGIVLLLVIGGIAGIVAEKLTDAHYSPTMNASVGISGAVGLGLFLNVFDFPVEAFWGGLVTATTGSALAIWAFHVLTAKYPAVPREEAEGLRQAA